MKPRNKTRALAAMLLVALAASQAGAHEDDTAAEIWFLKARLNSSKTKSPARAICPGHRVAPENGARA